MDGERGLVRFAGVVYKPSDKYRHYWQLKVPATRTTIPHDVSKHMTMHQFCWVINNAWAARRRDEK